MSSPIRYLTLGTVIIRLDQIRTVAKGTKTLLIQYIHSSDSYTRLDNDNQDLIDKWFRELELTLYMMDRS